MGIVLSYFSTNICQTTVGAYYIGLPHIAMTLTEEVH